MFLFLYPCSRFRVNKEYWSYVNSRYVVEVNFRNFPRLKSHKEKVDRKLRKTMRTQILIHIDRTRIQVFSHYNCLYVINGRENDIRTIRGAFFFLVKPFVIAHNIAEKIVFRETRLRRETRFVVVVCKGKIKAKRMSRIRQRGRRNYQSVVKIKKVNIQVKTSTHDGCACLPDFGRIIIQRFPTGVPRSQKVP